MLIFKGGKSAFRSTFKREKGPLREEWTFSLDLNQRKLTVDGRSNESNRSSFASSQVKWEVVSVTLMHDFHPEVSAVQNVSPGVDDTTLAIEDRLVEVETVEVECHGADAQGGHPNPNHWPGSQEEVK
jgi:hypothetical protein